MVPISTPISTATNSGPGVGGTSAGTAKNQRRRLKYRDNGRHAEYSADLHGRQPVHVPEAEGLQPTGHDKLLLARSRQVDWDWLREELSALEKAVRSRDVGLIKQHLQNIVPEYQA